MIQVKNLTKKFEKFTALDRVSFEIPKGSIYGVVGANGAGKSTLLRVLAGVYVQDEGAVELEGQPIYNNVEAKAKLVFVPDEPYFLRGASIRRMAKLYEAMYPYFDMDTFRSLIETFQLDPKQGVNALSKGMKRQVAIVLALACRPQYLLLDETFDGLDPVVRNLVKSIVCKQVEEDNMTVILSSHSLRELEGLCDQLALLYKGGVIFESDITDIKTSLFKVQVAFSYTYDKTAFAGLNVLEFHQQGTVSNLIVRGDREETIWKLRKKEPTILEVLPLSLEEVFTYELSASGYAFDMEEGKGEHVDEKQGKML